MVQQLGTKSVKARKKVKNLSLKSSKAKGVKGGLDFCHDGWVQHKVGYGGGGGGGTGKV